MTEAVQSHNSKLLSTLDSAAAKATEAGKTFDEQARLLTQASVDADEQARKLTEKEQEGRRDLFLKTARFIIEDLNSTAIDLTRALYSEVSEADWKRYTRGDRGVFTRVLMRGPPCRDDLANRSQYEGKSRHARLCDALCRSVRPPA